MRRVIECVREKLLNPGSNFDWDRESDDFANRVNAIFKYVTYKHSPVPSDVLYEDTSRKVGAEFGMWKPRIDKLFDTESYTWSKAAVPVTPEIQKAKDLSWAWCFLEKDTSLLHYRRFMMAIVPLIVPKGASIQITESAVQFQHQLRITAKLGRLIVNDEDAYASVYYVCMHWLADFGKYHTFRELCTKLVNDDLVDRFEADNVEDHINLMLESVSLYQFNWTLPTHTRLRDEGFDETEAPAVKTGYTTPADVAWNTMVEDTNSIDMMDFMDNLPPTMTLGEMRSKFAELKLRALRVLNLHRHWGWSLTDDFGVPDNIRMGAKVEDVYSLAFFWAVATNHDEHDEFGGLVAGLLAIMGAQQYPKTQVYAPYVAYVKYAEAIDDFPRHFLELAPPDVPPSYDELPPTYVATPPYSVGDLPSYTRARPRARKRRSERLVGRPRKRTEEETEETAGGAHDETGYSGGAHGFSSMDET